MFEIVWSEGGDPAEIVETRGLKQVTDTGAIEKAVDAIIAANPDKVEQVKAKPAMLGWFVGQVMKSTGGKANPQAVNDALKKKLGHLAPKPLNFPGAVRDECCGCMLSGFGGGMAIAAGTQPNQRLQHMVTLGKFRTSLVAMAALAATATLLAGTASAYQCKGYPTQAVERAQAQSRGARQGQQELVGVGQEPVRALAGRYGRSRRARSINCNKQPDRWISSRQRQALQLRGPLRRCLHKTRTAQTIVPSSLDDAIASVQ